MSVHIQALHSNKTLPWACPLCWWALPREQRTAGRRPELAFKEYTTYAAHIADYHVKGRYACRYPGCRFPPVDLVHKVREHYALVHGGSGNGGSGSGSGSTAAIAGPAAGKAQVKVEVKVEAEEDEKKEEVKREEPKDGGKKESAEKKPPPNKKPASKKGKRSANKVVNSSSSGGGGGEGPPVKSEDTAEDGDGNGEAGDGDPLAATSSSPRAARLHARVIRFNKVGANN